MDNCCSKRIFLEFRRNYAHEYLDYRDTQMFMDGSPQERNTLATASNVYPTLSYKRERCPHVHMNINPRNAHMAESPSLR